MNFKQLLETLENAILDFILSIIFIPRTLWMVVRTPKNIPEFIDIEIGKEELRFQRHVQPLLFWTFLGIIPYYFLFLLVLNIGDASQSEFTKAFNAISPQVRIISLIIFLISIPLACAFTTQLFKKDGLNKTDLKRALYIQCYCFAPVQLLYIPILMITENKETFWDSLGIVSLLSLGLFVYSEIAIIRKELNSGFLKAILVLSLMYGFSIVFGMIAMAIVFVIDYDHIIALINAFMKDMGL